MTSESWLMGLPSRTPVALWYLRVSGDYKRLNLRHDFQEGRAWLHGLLSHSFDTNSQLARVFEQALDDGWQAYDDTGASLSCCLSCCNSSLTLTPSTGAFNGTFTLMDGTTVRSSVPFQGMLVLTEGLGYGYFMLPQLADPTASPPTTETTSPILYGWMFLGR